MKRHVFLPLCAGLVAGFLLSLVFFEVGRVGVEEKALAAWRSALPSTPFVSARRIEAFDEGVMELRAGDRILYGSTDGRWLILGHIYEPATNTDWTQSRLDSLSGELP